MASAENMKKKAAIIGSGLVGRSWAMLFASVGWNVSLYDILPTQISDALENIKVLLKNMDQEGLLKGSLTADQQFNLISGSNNFEECVMGAAYVQEAVPERLELKQETFKKLDAIVGEGTILASSTSFIPASKFSENLVHREQVIVAHPTNPPYFIPLVELVPTPWTKPSIVDRTKAIMLEMGQVPTILKKEIDGFVLNRMQYALLTECWRLIRDGVASVEDVDKTMSYGLGHRYAFLGPLEVAHLNAEGMESYCERYGSSIQRIADGFGAAPVMNRETLEETGIFRQLCEMAPMDSLQEKRVWRDGRLIAFSKFKRDLDAKDKQSH